MQELTWLAARTQHRCTMHTNRTCCGNFRRGFQSFVLIKLCLSARSVCRPPPDPNSQFMRKVKAATIERAIQASEAHDRHANGESARPYDRKKDYYSVLGIDQQASAAEVRRAFRRLSLKWHPDKVAHKSAEERNEAAALFAALKEAHEVLGHEATRREYDQMMGVDELMADKDFDLADVEAALSRVKEGLGKRRPPPTYYEVDVTLEELYTGCVKEVTHVKAVGPHGTRKEINLRIAVPRGAVGGTEFVFRHMGDAPPGGTAGDVILVLRELDHPTLVRHGDELVHAHSREAKPEELLLRLAVPTLFGREVSVIADTLGVRMLDEGDVAMVVLPGMGMPRTGGERRQRYVTSSRRAGSAGTIAAEAAAAKAAKAKAAAAEKKAAAAARRAGSAGSRALGAEEGKSSSGGGGGSEGFGSGGGRSCSNGGSNGGSNGCSGVNGSGKIIDGEIEWLVEELSSTVVGRQDDELEAEAGGAEEETGGEDDEGSDDDEDDDDEAEVMETDEGDAESGTGTGAGGAPIGPYGFGSTTAEEAQQHHNGIGEGRGRQHVGGRRLGEEMYGDLIVTFAARECMRGKESPRAVIHLPTLTDALPPVTIIGPRPRPALASASREARLRDKKLRSRLVVALTRHVLPHAKLRIERTSRMHALGGGAGPSASGPAIWLTLGGSPPLSTEQGTECGLPASPASASELSGETETAPLCVRLLRCLAPGVAVQRLWLPSPPGSSSSASSPTAARCGLPLLDDEVALLESSPLVILEFCPDGLAAATAGASNSAAAAAARRGPGTENATEAEALEGMRAAVAHTGTYLVTWQPGVFVRAAPSRYSPVVGIRRARCLISACRRCGDWIEIASAARGAGTLDESGWVLTCADGSGLGRLVVPQGGLVGGAAAGGGGAAMASRGWEQGRSALELNGVEAAVRGWKRHAMLSLLRREHTLRGLPIVATEDACALLGSDTGYMQLLAWRVRAMRGEASVLAAKSPPPPPPAGFELPDLSSAYAPPKAYEAGGNIFDFSKILDQGVYTRQRPPPAEPPTELRHVQNLCMRASKGGKHGGKHGGNRDGNRGDQRGGRGGMQAIGLAEDEVLTVSCGGRFETAPERSALLESRLIALTRRIRNSMNEAYEETAGFEVRLSKLRVEFSAMNQYVDKRLPTLCLYTEKELRKWFQSSGYDSPNLNKTDELKKARRLRDESLARLQLYAQRRHYELMLSVAQRCTMPP